MGLKNWNYAFVRRGAKTCESRVKMLMIFPPPVCVCVDAYVRACGRARADKSLATRLAPCWKCWQYRRWDWDWVSRWCECDRAISASDSDTHTHTHAKRGGEKKVWYWLDIVHLCVVAASVTCEPTPVSAPHCPFAVKLNLPDICLLCRADWDSVEVCLNNCGGVSGV